MAEIVAYFQTSTGAPLTGPAGANIPEVLVVRTPADTVAQAAIDMTELVNAPGWYQFTFPTVDGEEYVWIADGDPAVAGQVPATGRYVRGAISGTEVERQEVDIPAILVDTDVTIPGLIAALNDPTVAAIADGVWDEDIVAAHGAASSAGLLVRALGAAISTRANSPTLAALLAVPDVASATILTAIADWLETSGTNPHGTGAWDAVGAGITPQQVRDAMKLTPTVGVPSAGSVDEHLDTIEGRVDVATSTRSSHSAADVDTTLTGSHGAGSWTTATGFATSADAVAILAAISALNDIDIADVQTALTNQGYTAARALLLDNLDAAISSIATAISGLNDLSQADVQSAMTAQGYTSARALLIDNLDATISSVLTAIAALNDPDAGAIADAVWTEVLSAHETATGSAAEALAVLRNRIRIDFTAGPPRELVVYDQAGTTELYRAPLTTTNGTEVLAFFGVQHERGTPV